MQSEGYSDRVQEGMELMKGRLAFLPKIRQEMQSVLALSPNKELTSVAHYAEFSPFLELGTTRKIISRLQEILSRLDKLPSIQEILNESDCNKLTSMFREFEITKLNACREILTLQTNSEAGIQNWMFPNNRVWAVNILPFFYVPARIVLVWEKTGCQAVFGVCSSEENVSISVLKMDFPQKFAEAMEKPFRQIDLFQETGQLSLDGIEYELSSISRTSKSTIWFGNPFTSPFIEIEKAFISIAEMVVNEKGQQAERNYLKEWKRYLER